MRIKSVLSTCVISSALLSSAFLMTGCGMGVQDTTKSVAVPELGQPMAGSLYGGRQPISGASVYMFAANTTGSGAASVSLINNYPGGSYPSQVDANGNYYVTTNSNGGFNLAAGEYSCTAGGTPATSQQVYIYAIGGNPGSGTNAAAGLMAVLGYCEAGGTFSAVTSRVNISEVSTIAAAYAMAGYATDSTHVSSSGSTLAETGILNAFSNAAQMYNINSINGSTGLATTPGGNGTVPQSEIISLADSLAACINSTGAGSPGCSGLFTNVMSNGTTGTTAADTATEAIYIAHNPGVAVSAIWANAGSSPPYSGGLTSAPTDWTVAITFTDTSFQEPANIAIDGSGNAWVTNSATGAESSLTELNPLGVILSGTGYYTDDMDSPTGIAMDTTGNAWVADISGNLIEIPSTGMFGGTTTEHAGLTASGTQLPESVAIDGSGNLWVAQDSATGVEFASGGGSHNAVTGGTLGQATGVAIDASGKAFYADNDVSTGRTTTYGEVSIFSSARVAQTTGTYPYAQALHQVDTNSIAIDGSGYFWATNYTSNSITELNNTGGIVNTPGYFSGGGLSHPTAVALDGNGYVWIANATGSISAFTSAGTSASSGGYQSSGTSLSGISGIAPDSSGNVWVCNKSAGNVTEFIGASTPVVTPIVANFHTPYSAPASLP